ncbi:hypothetical protein [Lysinibacillus sp. BPa_S21]|uniref:hypothetical protein n=1 Tax=Lysinibacillus sp. BPa_S21 TaxID=2932478 RepID=UPI0020114326|nr:hypothetical protein [Lysinibacillus sp. BPa_S21]MCL1694584.1 hypothetical protein [Lysinibacillus sp. BPa_S21]
MDYKTMVEEKFGKPLKEIMYVVCVEKGMEKWEGAELLGVPIKTFTAWRSKFRFGPMQVQADKADKMRKETIEKYNDELKEVNLARPFENKGENSLKEFKELTERILELEKYKRTIQEVAPMSEIAITLKIGMLESTLESIIQFESGKLYDQYMFELQNLKDD